MYSLFLTHRRVSYNGIVFDRLLSNLFFMIPGEGDALLCKTVYCRLSLSLHFPISNLLKYFSHLALYLSTKDSEQNNLFSYLKTNNPSLFPSTVLSDFPEFLGLFYIDDDPSVLSLGSLKLAHTKSAPLNQLFLILYLCNQLFVSTLHFA